MDILNLLKKDHKVVSELFSAIDQTGTKAYKTKMELFEQIYNELLLHAKIEEAIFYPTIEKFQETKSTTMESYEEHMLVKQLLEEIKNVTPQDDVWQAKLTVLKELVEHHVREEEKELFPNVKKVLPLDELKLMGEKMQEIKAANTNNSSMLTE